MVLLPVLVITLHCILAFGTSQIDIPRVSWSALQADPALSKTFINSPAIITDTPLHEWLSGKYEDTENRKPWLWLKEHLSGGSSNLTTSEEIENILSSLDHTLSDRSPVDYSYQDKGDFTFFSDGKTDDIHQPSKWTEMVENSDIFAHMRCDASSEQKDCGPKFQMTAHLLARKQENQSGVNGDLAMHMPPITVMNDIRQWLKAIDPVLKHRTQAVKTMSKLFW